MYNIIDFNKLKSDFTPYLASDLISEMFDYVGTNLLPMLDELYPKAFAKYLIDVERIEINNQLYWFDTNTGAVLKKVKLIKDHDPYYYNPTQVVVL